MLLASLGIGGQTAPHFQKSSKKLFHIDSEWLRSRYMLILQWRFLKFKLFNLIYLNQSVLLTISQIRVSEVAGLNDESLFGSKCLTAGWGLTRTNGHRSAVLRKAVTMTGSKKYFIYSENFITKCETIILILFKSRGFSSSFLSEF